MEIRLCTHGEYLEVRKLWEQVFSEDSKEFLDFYWDRIMRYNQVIIACEENKIVGMVHLNPYVLQVELQTYKVYYVVGVGTDQSFRRQGIMKSMMEYAERVAIDQKIDYLILLPEDERYYIPFGFEFVSKQYNTTIYSDRYNIEGLVEKAISINDKESFSYWMKKTKSDRYTPVIDKNYITKLYEEILSEGGKIQIVNGNMIVYYLDETLEVRFIRYSDNGEGSVSEISIGQQKHDSFHLSKVRNWLIQKAEGKQIVIHEVNDNLVAKTFPYIRSNIYDYREYMMAKRLSKDLPDLKGHGIKFFFNEVI